MLSGIRVFPTRVVDALHDFLGYMSRDPSVSEPVPPHQSSNAEEVARRLAEQIAAAHVGRVAVQNQSQDQSQGPGSNI